MAPRQLIRPLSKVCPPRVSTNRCKWHHKKITYDNKGN